MNDGARWIVALVVAIAIIALLAFARGTPEHGDTDATPVPAAVALRG